MTALGKGVMDLLEKIPEDKLYYIVQIMQRVSGLYGTENQSVRDWAFAERECLRRKVPNLDCDKELENYREESYGTENIS